MFPHLSPRPRARIAQQPIAIAVAVAVAVAIAIAATAAAGCARRDEPLRDAWALWLEHEPTCLEPTDAAHAAHAATLSPRWRAALEALSEAALEAIEERLAEAARGENERALGELVAASRRLCELTRGEPVAALASTVTLARAEVAAARSRLVVGLPLGSDEVRRRAGRYDRRLSRAVSDALERESKTPENGAIGPSAAKTASAGGRRAPESAGPWRPPESSDGGESRPEPPTTPDPPAAAGEAGQGGEAGEAGKDHSSSEHRLSIRPSSGEPWAVLRRRREEEESRRLARWRMVHRQGLRALAEARAELAYGLRDDSLEGLWALCLGVGRAAEAVPQAVVDGAPTSSLRSELAALLESYAGAGRACGAGRTVLAWERLSAGDRRWEVVERTVARLAAGPVIPESLRRERGAWNAAGQENVE